MENDVFALVMVDLMKRNEKGWKQHSRPLTVDTPMNEFRELYEELLDAVVYLRKLMARLERVEAADYAGPGVGRQIPCATYPSPCTSPKSER